ncbi:MAG: hypothetical protein C6I01_03375 [Epsilonproteobacteria bacterium]|nr:hypothetical protein [Campylobacterota bacterium]
MIWCKCPIYGEWKGVTILVGGLILSFFLPYLFDKLILGDKQITTDFFGIMVTYIGIVSISIYFYFLHPRFSMFFQNIYGITDFKILTAKTGMVIIKGIFIVIFMGCIIGGIIYQLTKADFQEYIIPYIILFIWINSVNLILNFFWRRESGKIIFFHLWIITNIFFILYFMNKNLEELLLSNISSLVFFLNLILLSIIYFYLVVIDKRKFFAIFTLISLPFISLFFFLYYYSSSISLNILLLISIILNTIYIFSIYLLNVYFYLYYKIQGDKK